MSCHIFLGQRVGKSHENSSTIEDVLRSCGRCRTRGKQWNRGSGTLKKHLHEMVKNGMVDTPICQQNFLGNEHVDGLWWLHPWFNPLILVPTLLVWNMNWKVKLLSFVGLCVTVGWFSLRPKLGLKDLEDGNVEYKALPLRVGNVLQGMMFTVDRSWIMVVLLICHAFAFESLHNWIYNDVI